MRIQELLRWWDAGRAIAMAGLAWAGIASTGSAAEATNRLTAEQGASIWESGVGEGFRRNALAINVSTGPGVGVKIFGSEHYHDWWLGTVDVEWILSEVVAKDKWYRGNWEIAFEVFGGQQYEPSSAYLVGFTPLLRYDFAIGHRWVIFAQGGSGGTLTDIRDGDLSTTFEFALQAGVGAHFFIDDHVSLNIQTRFIHLSNANLDVPNLGVNNVTFLFGVSWWF
jgi:opacity protein-like surface antigen